MRSQLLLPLAVVGLAAAAPAPTLEARGQPLGSFNVTSFNYECSAGGANPCSWDFYVSDALHAKNHPGIAEPVHCTGNSNTTTTYVEGSCSASGSKKSYIAAWVKSATSTYPSNLRLSYVYEKNKNVGYYFFAATTVATGSAQPTDFVLPEAYYAET